MTEEEIEKMKEEIKEETKKEVEAVLNEKHKTEMDNMKKELHTAKSQAGDFKKQLETMQNADKSQEELLQSQLEEKEKDIQKKNEELEAVKAQLQVKELETKKAELVKKHEISNEFMDFIVVTHGMKDEELEKMVTETKKKEDAFKAKLLKSYSITDNPNLKKKTEGEKDDEEIEKLVEKSNQSVSEDIWK